MRLPSALLLLCILAAGASTASAAEAKRRVIVLTDIENEPDDTQSMVRFLVYSSHWDVEALVATTSVHQRARTSSESIRKLVQAYGQVRENLLKHEPGYPTGQYLLSIIRDGKPLLGISGVGQGMDSPGSERIIEVVDRDDPRPVWVTVWGGPNCLAQALWKVRATRSPEDLDKFVAKLRVYTISDQDDSGPWLRKTFPGLFYVVSPGFNAGGAYHHATWSAISGDNFHGRFSGGDFTIVDNPWLDTHVRAKGPLGALYPKTEYLMEGDTPSFLFLINNGLSDPEHPDYGSWGGRYELYTPRTRKWFSEPETRPIWTDTEDEAPGIDGKLHHTNKATIWRWRQAYQNDFAARIDWTIKPYKEANHPPVAALSHPNKISVKSGIKVVLDADGSKDPDGDELSYEWIYYREVGTFESTRPIQIQDKNLKRASFIAPQVNAPKTIHVILAVTDNGNPALTRYQRVIVTVMP